MKTAVFILNEFANTSISRRASCIMLIQNFSRACDFLHYDLSFIGIKIYFRQF